MRLEAEPIVWLDLETGGIDPKVHQITQVGAVATVGGELVMVHTPDTAFERKVQLVPGHYTDEALAVQGYSEERWANALPIAQVLEELRTWLQPFTHPATSKKGKEYKVCHLGGHNLEFDVKFLEATCVRNGTGARGFWLPVTKWTGGWLDTLHLATWVRALYGHGYDNLQLETLCAYYEVPVPNAHDALGDVLATVELARQLTRQLRYDWASVT